MGLKELTDFIFAGDRVLCFHDFMAMVLQLRGSNHATVKDIVDLRHFMVVAISELHSVMIATIKTHKQDFEDAKRRAHTDAYEDEPSKKEGPSMMAMQSMTWGMSTGGSSKRNLGV